MCSAFALAIGSYPAYSGWRRQAISLDAYPGAVILLKDTRKVRLLKTQALFMLA
jgi:hypothetical protein